MGVQVCTPLQLLPSCDDYHKKLIGIFLSNIDQYNHMYIFRYISHPFLAIKFDVAIT